MLNKKVKRTVYSFLAGKMTIVLGKILGNCHLFWPKYLCTLSMTFATFSEDYTGSLATRSVDWTMGPIKVNQAPLPW